MSKQIEVLLNNCEMAINNALNVPELAEALSMYGYTSERIRHGNELYKCAKQAAQQQIKEYGDQYAATSQVNDIREATNKVYMIHLKLARIIFENELDATKALMLSGDRKTSISGYLTQTETFYANLLANEEWMHKFSKYNIHQEQLLKGKEAVNQLQTAYAAQLRESGEAQKATQTRDELMDDLSKWYGEFIKVARIALMNEPQLLVMLGV